MKRKSNKLSSCEEKALVHFEAQRIKQKEARARKRQKQQSIQRFSLGPQQLPATQAITPVVPRPVFEPMSSQTSQQFREIATNIGNNIAQAAFTASLVNLQRQNPPAGRGRGRGRGRGGGGGGGRGGGGGGGRGGGGGGGGGFGPGFRLGQRPRLREPGQPGIMGNLLDLFNRPSDNRPPLRPRVVPGEQNRQAEPDINVAFGAGDAASMVSNEIRSGLGALSAGVSGLIGSGVGAIGSGSRRVGGAISSGLGAIGSGIARGAGVVGSGIARGVNLLSSVPRQSSDGNLEMTSLLGNLIVHDYTQPNDHVHSNRNYNVQKKQDLSVDDDEVPPNLEENDEKQEEDNVRRNLFNVLYDRNNEEKEKEEKEYSPQQLRKRYEVAAGKGKSPYVKYNNKTKSKLIQDALKLNETDSRALFREIEENAPNTIRYPYPGSNLRLAALNEDYGLNEQGVVVHRVTLLPHPDYPRMGLPNSPNLNRYAFRPKKKFSNQEVSDYFGDTENQMKAKRFYKKVLNHPDPKYRRFQIYNEIDESPLIRLNQQFALNSRGIMVPNPAALPRPDYSSMSSSSSSSSSSNRIGDYSAQMSSPPPMTSSNWNLQLFPFASPLVLSQTQSPAPAPAIPEGESMAAESELSELMEEFMLVGKAL